VQPGLARRRELLAVGAGLERPVGHSVRAEAAAVAREVLAVEFDAAVLGAHGLEFHAPLPFGRERRGRGRDMAWGNGVRSLKHSSSRGECTRLCVKRRRVGSQSSSSKLIGWPSAMSPRARKVGWLTE